MTIKFIDRASGRSVELHHVSKLSAVDEYFVFEAFCDDVPMKYFIDNEEVIRTTQSCIAMRQVKGGITVI
jgi:hypothetical protein